MINPDQLKDDFPIFQRQVKNKSLIYLDNAATSQKPKQVIAAMADYYRQHNANVHRGVHQLADESTQVWEDSRATIAEFFQAKPEELVLTRNTTEAINGVAYGWADQQLQAKDAVLTTIMEHHSNLVPWQQLCQRTGAKLVLARVDQTGRLDLTDFNQKLNQYPIKLVALVYVSNALGTVNPLEKIVNLVRKADKKQSGSRSRAIRILVDGAQAAPHLPVNFAQLGIDFFAFSGHKMLGPMGVGGLLVRQELLTSGEFQPWLFGGGMINQVSKQQASFAEDLADRFTAGTPDVSSAAGLAVACEYLNGLDMTKVRQHDQELVNYAIEKLQPLPEVEIVGPVTNEQGQLPVADRVGSVTFLYRGVHAHDVAQVLASEGVAVRSGHHCTMPLHQHFGWQATIRASFQIYNSRQDIDQLVIALDKVKDVIRL